MEIEVDAKVVVKWVLGRMCNNYAHSTLILYCKQLMRQVSSVKIKHCLLGLSKGPDPPENPT